MKKILLTMIGAAAFVCLNAQISLTYQTHGLKVGDSHDFIMAQPVEEGFAGENVVWDFSGLVPANRTLTSHMLNTSVSEKATEISSANTILEEYGNHFFFRVNKNAMEQFGTVCGNTVTKYDKPFLKLKFPFTYGSKYAGEYSGTLISQNTNTPVNGTYDITGDAYGTLILPGNVSIDNVLRVKQTRTIKYNNGAAAVNEITYRWYSVSVRYPLLVIIKYVQANQSSNVAQVAYYAHATNETKSAPVMQASSSITGIDAFPNPFNEEFTVAYKLEKATTVKVDVIDASGKTVQVLQAALKQSKGDYILKVSSAKAGLKSGVNYIRITCGDESFVRKLVKQ